METQEYQGWSNRETWAAALWIGNDQVLHEIARDYASITLQNGEDSDGLNSYYLGETLKNWIEEDLLTLENISGNRDLWLMLTDIGSLYRVNWREIAEGYLSELKEEASA
jgi:hypothetical protein